MKPIQRLRMKRPKAGSKAALTLVELLLMIP